MQTNHITTVIIGGGQAGLAMSRCLTDEGIDHVVLERGRTAERWRSERWDSLRLLTPNWQSRLPGWEYQGADADGFMTMPEVVGYLEAYARSFTAPVSEETTVLSVGPTPGGGYIVETYQGRWIAETVVVATGACAVPWKPAVADSLGSTIDQVVPTHYRNPDQLSDGGVLVVGAAASGVQLADELAAAGRDVVLSVGEHNRVPRTYRGVDIQRWLDISGVWGQHVDTMGDVERARQAASLQLVGSPDRRSIDLDTIRRRGVRLAGRVETVDGNRFGFDDGLGARVAASERRMHRLLDKADMIAAAAGMATQLAPADRPDPIAPVDELTGLDLDASGIGTVIWATGFRRSYPWLNVPVTDRSGDIVQRRGATASPGLYVLGMPAQIRRNSTFIDGVGRDAQDVTVTLRNHLEHIARITTLAAA